MNKPSYLGLSILESSKILMYQFWHDLIGLIKDKLGGKILIEIVRLRAKLLNR